MMTKKIKTEHSGAKNGGGYWGKREEAKQRSKELRRAEDRELEGGAELLVQLEEGPDELEEYVPRKRTRNWKAHLEGQLKFYRQKLKTTEWDWFRSHCRSEIERIEGKLKELEEEEE